MQSWRILFSSASSQIALPFRCTKFSLAPVENLRGTNTFLSVFSGQYMKIDRRVEHEQQQRATADLVMHEEQYVFECHRSE